MGGNYPFEQGPQARAITWDEARRMGGGGGGGPGGPDREPSWLGKKFREIASRLIDQERDTLETTEAQTPAEYIENRRKQSDLSDEFNRINDEPGIGGTVEAIRTITRYKAPLLYKLAFAEPTRA